MVKKSLFYFCFLMAVLVPIFACAQPKLRIASLTSQPADTVIYPNTTWITYYLVVENVGDNQLTGPCYLKYRYNSFVGDSTKIAWSAFNFEVGETDTFEIHDTIGVLNTSKYKGGDNIIVIWPQTDNINAQAPDTNTFPIYIKDISSSVDPIILQQRVKIFPNPSCDYLKLSFDRAKHKVEYVRILGIDSKILCEYQNSIDLIDLTNIPNGLYFVNIRFRDGIEGVLRFEKVE